MGVTNRYKMKKLFFSILFVTFGVTYGSSQEIKLEGHTSDSLFVIVENFDLNVYRNGKIKYSSPITRAQKLKETSRIRVIFWNRENELGFIYSDGTAVINFKNF